MADFVSEIKTIPHDEERIYNMLSDMRNMAQIKDHIPTDKVKNFEFDNDSFSVTVDPVGKITFQIIDREPCKLVKFAANNSPVPLTIWIQLKSVSTAETKMKLTLRADINVMLKSMVSKPLQDAVDKLSTIIATLPY